MSLSAVHFDYIPPLVDSIYKLASNIDYATWQDTSECWILESRGGILNCPYVSGHEHVESCYWWPFGEKLWQQGVIGRNYAADGPKMIPRSFEECFNVFQRFLSVHQHEDYQQYRMRNVITDLLLPAEVLC